MADLSETRLIGQLDGKHVGERTLVGLDVSDEEPEDAARPQSTAGKSREARTPARGYFNYRERGIHSSGSADLAPRRAADIDFQPTLIAITFDSEAPIFKPPSPGAKQDAVYPQNCLGDFSPPLAFHFALFIRKTHWI